MKSDFTRIAVILDRSGSMASLRESTVAGFNEFIRMQRALPGEASVKLVQFDEEYEVVFDKPLNEVPLLTQDVFVPRGWTALLDAQGRTIVDLGKELAAMDESERPSKVIVMTLTDGMENRSRQFNLARVAALIAQQREVYKWEFVYVGANQDAVAVAQTMNIPASAAMTFAASPRALTGTMAAAGALFSHIRAGRPAAFSDEDRKKAVETAEPANTA